MLFHESAGLSMSSLKIMLGIAEKFGKEFDISFNSDKYQFIVYGDNQTEGIYHNGVFVKSQCTANHLGNIISPEMNEKSVTYLH